MLMIANQERTKDLESVAIARSRVEIWVRRQASWYVFLGPGGN